MKIGRFVFERKGFWFRWFWQYKETEHGFTQYKNGRSELRNPFYILWLVIWRIPEIVGIFLIYISALMCYGKDEADRKITFL